MIPNKEKEGWHCLAVKNLPALLRGITSRHHGGFYYLNCLHFFRTENKLKSHKKVCINKDFCGTVMPSEQDKILEVRDHCHDTGKYRSAADSICNFKINVSNEIAVVFHDGSNYDYHFSVKD